MAHCNQYFCRLYRTVYNKKKKYLQKPIPTVACQGFFLRAKTFFSVGVSGTCFFFSFWLLFLTFFSLPLQTTFEPPTILGVRVGGVSGCGGFLAVQRGGRGEGSGRDECWTFFFVVVIFFNDVCWADSSCCQGFSQLLVPAHLLGVLLLQTQQRNHLQPSHQSCIVLKNHSFTATKKKMADAVS